MSGAIEVTLSSRTSHPQTIDYEGSRYRTDFWDGQGREYEDRCERAAIHRLLPETGNIIMEAGAGFGRLAALYDGYKSIILMDYSMSLLQEAKQKWGQDQRFVFVAANIYELPFVDNLLDTVVMVRVMHHLQMPSVALNEIVRVLQGGKTFVLEYANKRNAKAITRYWLGRQTWNPFAHDPVEFVTLNYDFHPAWMDNRLQEAGLISERELSISSFRLEALKRRVPTPWLVRLDSAFAGPGAALKLSPSIMVRCRNGKESGPITGFFRCLSCGNPDMQRDDLSITCTKCSSQWPIQNGVYDFRSKV